MWHKFIGIFLIVLSLASCETTPKTASESKHHLRKVHDTIGFAQYSWQMDSIYKRLGVEDKINNKQWKMAISPHDDYKYAGELYHRALEGINAKTIILIGVAHRARNFDLQDKIIFGTHTQWQSPYGTITVSDVNKSLYEKLDKKYAIVHDSMQVLEHSLEAIIPFLHKKNRKAEIIPILIPYMNYTTMEEITKHLAIEVTTIMQEKNWSFGSDVAIVISNDAVHYGDEDWSRNLAPYGTDSLGTVKARQHDLRIIDELLSGPTALSKIKSFTEETVQKSDYKKYKWVWCGRYSVPFGVALGHQINKTLHQKPLIGVALGYQSSIDHELIKVADLGMGTTAIATHRHWVAYTAIKYE